jgi:hypothetical protein
MGLIGCPEMSVRNYHYMLCNIAEEHRSYLIMGHQLTFHVWKGDCDWLVGDVVEGRDCMLAGTLLKEEEQRSL